MSRQAVFAVPGDLDSVTGGYIYEKQLLLGLRRAGWDVAHLALPGSFPDPTPKDMQVTGDAFAALAPQTPVLLDGFLPGATDPAQLARLRAPFVAVTHHPLALETGLAPGRAAHLYRVERANLARAAHVIVPSAETARTLAADYDVPAARITVAPPGVTRPEAGPEAAAPGPPLILSVGLLVPRKGHDVLLRALAEVADLPWRAVIVGGSPDPACAADLRSLQTALGLDGRVSFAGQVAEDTLGRHFSQAAVFALATRYEGYGMVFAEALVHGLPIVGCSGGAVADTVPAEAALLVPPDDAAGLAWALRRVLADPNARARIAAASARHGAMLPTWDETAGIVAQVLARIACG
ncbi:glycosyltransferase involved in cell wall biosynthesis [Rhodovulum iodosum]|uniref:Glycosyltransferase involved in cell wall biosynthesis n=1 Tax=Rhodovulum iodosum TaxID=68291 RepID=A0ABV3XR38_9RHOB|nr:glycosyltransferase family 4 protein [Rhodovulum robiginosum]RSK32804.1 glycosyltransferase family 1 protein [Rhodovulum robiginosum]